MSYINISGTFHYLCGILDGCSRYIVNWDLRESMTESDIEIILERAGGGAKTAAGSPAAGRVIPLGSTLREATYRAQSPCAEFRLGKRLRC